MDIRIILTIILAVAIGLPTVVLALSAWSGQQDASAAKSWPTTTGIITASEVIEVQRRKKRSTSVSTYYMATYHAPHVTYEYVVEGKTYQAERLQMGQVLLSSDTADPEKQIAAYPVGASVTVYHNPDDPAQATLSPTTPSATRTLWIVALALVALFVVIEIAMWTDKTFTPH